eukprot:5017448-Pleurochrysis_carterae.AAC.1
MSGTRWRASRSICIAEGVLPSAGNYGLPVNFVRGGCDPAAGVCCNDHLREQARYPQLLRSSCKQQMAIYTLAYGTARGGRVPMAAEHDEQHAAAIARTDDRCSTLEMRVLQAQE